MNRPSYAALAIALAATLSLSAQTVTTTKRVTAAHKATTARKSASAKPAEATQSSEGLAAVGTMPAAAGPSKPLYTLRYVDLVVGTGELAQPRKFYTVNYTGWTTDGKKFDSSYDHGDAPPFFFPVGARRVIAGWDTGFEGMHVGGKRRLIVPYQLAYGELGHPPEIPAKADLIFDVELVAQSDTPPQQPPRMQPPPGRTTTDQPDGQQQSKPQNQPQTQPTPQPGTNPVTNPDKVPDQSKPTPQPEKD